MDLKLVKKFIALAKKEGVQSLSYKEGETSVSVEFSSGEVIHTQMLQGSLAEVKKVNGDLANIPNEVVDENILEVTAPFVGTFYSSPGPDEPVFVKKGDIVGKGQTLCILEAMKIMNEIESDISGEIIEVCIDNEEFVEFGQVLFRIRKS